VKEIPGSRAPGGLFLCISRWRPDCCVNGIMETESGTRAVWTPLWVFFTILLLAFGSALTGVYVARLAQPEFSVAAQDYADEPADSGAFNRPSPLGPRTQ
jgi:hypothetical protein